MPEIRLLVREIEIIGYCIATTLANHDDTDTANGMPYDEMKKLHERFNNLYDYASR